MQTIIAVNPAETTGKTKQLLDAVQGQLGMVPNLMRTLAASPAALEGYLSFGSALAKGRLGARFREQIALMVAQTNACEYCLSAHTALGTMAGLKPEDIAASREADSRDAKVKAGLEFAKTLVVERGQVLVERLEQLKEAGYSEGELTEIVANVAINIFTNYFNHVARTSVDFPLVSVAGEAVVRA